jgi:hypothetical protein
MKKQNLTYYNWSDVKKEIELRMGIEKFEKCYSPEIDRFVNLNSLWVEYFDMDGSLVRLNSYIDLEFTLESIDVIEEGSYDFVVNFIYVCCSVIDDYQIRCIDYDK